MKTAMLLIGFCLSSAWAVATFTSGPSFAAEGNGIRVTFAVSESADVEVAVVDPATGKVVRHLAQGLLGGQYDPPEPLVAGLSQSLAWDGKDDYGAWAADKPVTLRVRLGVRPVLHKTLRFGVPDTRYWNKALIPRNPRYDAQTDTFIDISGYIFSDSYTDSSLYPTKTGMNISVNDETDEILVVREARYADAQLAKYDGLGEDTAALQQLSLSGTITDSVDGVSISYGPRFQFGEQWYSWDGRYIYHDEMNSNELVYRFNASDGSQAKFWHGANYLRTHFYGDQLPFGGRGACEGPDGTLYYAGFADTMNQGWWGMSNGTTAAAFVVKSYDPDGRLINDHLLRLLCDVGEGIRVDLKGNIYMGLLIKPKGDTVPPEIRSRLPGSPTGIYFTGYTNGEPNLAGYASCWYGSIVKFRPAGGTAYYNTAGQYMMSPDCPIEMTGHEWMYYGASIQTSWSPFRVRNSCACFTPRFDVDRFSRVIFPNVFENNYVCLDAEKNLLFKMHNRDFLKDSVYVGTGASLQATDNGLYIGDGTNNQVLCFSWVAAAEETLSIPVLGSSAEKGLLSGLALSAAASPNPFTRTVSITVTSAAEVAVYDINGRLVKKLAPASVHGLLSVYAWDGRDAKGAQMRNGFYFYKATTGHASVSGRLTLLR